MRCWSVSSVSVRVNHVRVVPLNDRPRRGPRNDDDAADACRRSRASDVGARRERVPTSLQPPVAVYARVTHTRRNERAKAKDDNDNYV